jgi:hypothetical protein
MPVQANPPTRVRLADPVGLGGSAQAADQGLGTVVPLDVPFRHPLAEALGAFGYFFLVNGLVIGLSGW